MATIANAGTVVLDQKLIIVRAVADQARTAFIITVPRTSISPGGARIVPTPRKANGMAAVADADARALADDGEAAVRHARLDAAGAAVLFAPVGVRRPRIVALVVEAAVEALDVVANGGALSGAVLNGDGGLGRGADEYVAGAAVLCAPLLARDVAGWAGLRTGLRA